MVFSGSTIRWDQVQSFITFDLHFIMVLTIKYDDKSIRIPLNVAKEGCGYLEDRRPAANLDPYLVCEVLCGTICL